MKNNDSNKKIKKKREFQDRDWTSYSISYDEQQYSLYDFKQQYQLKPHQTDKIRRGRPPPQIKFEENTSNLLCDGKLTIENDNLVAEIIQFFINYCEECGVKNFQSLGQKMYRQIKWDPESDYLNFFENCVLLGKIENVLRENQVEKQQVKNQFVWVLVYLRGLISLYMMEEITDIALKIAVIDNRLQIFNFAEDIFTQANSQKGLYSFISLKMCNKYKTIFKAKQNVKHEEMTIFKSAFITFIVHFWQCLKAVLHGRTQEPIVKKQQPISQNEQII